jgi:hypothetical protein
LGTTQTYTGTGSLAVKFPQVVHDTMMWYNTSTGVFNPQIEGFYQINVQLNVTPISITSDTEFDVHLQKNSSGSIYLYCKETLFVSDGAASGYINKFKNVSVTKILYFNGSTDRIGIVYAQQSTDDLTQVSVDGNLSISRVSL